MGKKFQKKHTKERLEIVPMDENLPLAPVRSSEDFVPKRVRPFFFLVKYVLRSNFKLSGKVGKQTTCPCFFRSWHQPQRPTFDA